MSYGEVWQVLQINWMKKKMLKLGSLSVIFHNYSLLVQIKS